MASRAPGLPLFLRLRLHRRRVISDCRLPCRLAQGASQGVASGCQAAELRAMPRMQPRGEGRTWPHATVRPRPGPGSRSGPCQLLCLLPLSPCGSMGTREVMGGWGQGDEGAGGDGGPGRAIGDLGRLMGAAGQSAHATRRSTALATPEDCPEAPGVGVGQTPALPVCALMPWALAPWPPPACPLQRDWSPSLPSGP